MSRYSIITRGMGEQADMQAMSVTEKCIYLMAMTLRRQNITGLIYITVKDLAKIVGVEMTQVKEALAGDRLKNRIEFFPDNGVLWIKDFVRQQFLGKLSPRQKKGILNRLMEYPDHIICKFLTFNRKMLNLNREELSLFNLNKNGDDCEEHEESADMLIDNEHIKYVNDKNDSDGNKYISVNNTDTVSDDIYFIHGYTLSQTSKPEPKQEPDKEPQQDQEPDPHPEDIPCVSDPVKVDDIPDKSAMVFSDLSVSGKTAPKADSPCKKETSPTVSIKKEDNPELSTDMVPGQLQNILVEMGINRNKSGQLVNKFDKNRIFRQIVWFPLRRMKSVGSLVSSIEEDWKKPYDEDEGAKRREASACARRNPGCISGRESACRFCPNKRNAGLALVS